MGGNIQEYPFTKWKCHKFPWKAAILQHQETVFLDDWNGDDSGKTGHLRMELLFFSVQTVLLKGMATTPCNPVTCDCESNKRKGGPSNIPWQKFLG
jgi:hypothetical protein